MMETMNDFQLLNTIVQILLTFSKCSCSSSATQIKFTNEIDMVCHVRSGAAHQQQRLSTLSAAALRYCHMTNLTFSHTLEV
jgi:hypothetical protein